MTTLSEISPLTPLRLITCARIPDHDHHAYQRKSFSTVIPRYLEDRELFVLVARRRRRKS